MIERFLIVMTIIVIGWVLFDRTDLPERSVTDDKACADRSTAWSMTRVIVRQHIGRPLLARFPDRLASSGLDGMSFHHLGDCRHRISAFVDAYYRHGDLRRRYFVIELSYHGRSGWRLDQLHFIESPNSWMST